MVILPILIFPTSEVHNHSYISLILRVCGEHPYILHIGKFCHRTVKESSYLYVDDVLGLLD